MKVNNTEFKFKVGPITLEWPTQPPAFLLPFFFILAVVGNVVWLTGMLWLIQKTLLVSGLWEKFIPIAQLTITELLSVAVVFLLVTITYNSK